MRIIGGEFRSRRLKSLQGNAMRPTPDRLREALFNVLATRVAGCTFLDAYAGCGAVGIEALSRGAAFVRFSDMNRAPIETINFNVEHCGFKSQAEIRRADAFTFLSSPSDRKFEYIYIAPPQYQDMWAKALELVDENPEWLSEDGWVIAQIDPKEYKPLALENLEEFEQRKYGTTLLVFYERKEPV